MVLARSRSPSKQSGTSAHVAQPNAANEVSTPSRLPWQPAGDVTICDKGRPAFSGIPTTAGIYRLDIGDHSYIGQGGNLRQRLHEYRNPTDNFDEHYRRHRIVQAGGAKLFLITNQEMEDRTARLGMERAAIAEATSDGMSLLNRGKKAKDYFQLKAEFLEEQIALTRKAYDAAD